MENETATNDAIQGRVNSREEDFRLSPFCETFLVAGFLGITNLLANYLLSPFFGIYEDDYMLFLGSQSWRATQLWGYLHWVFTTEPQGRPIGWALNGLLGYATAGHGLELAYAAGWLILTVNAVLIYVVLKRAANWFAAIVGAAVYLVLPVDLSKVILMHRIFVHASMMFVLIGLALYTTGKLRWKLLGFTFAIFSLTIWEGFYLAFLVAPFLEQRPARERIRNFLMHLVLFVIPVGVALGIRYISGEQRVTAMASGGSDMIARMLKAMVIGPFTGLSTFFLRPCELLLVGNAFPKLIGGIFFALVAGYLILLRSRPVDPEGGAPAKGVFLGISAFISLVAPYVLMYRAEYFPANMTIGRLTCGHAPAAFGYATGAAFCAYTAWNVLRRFRRATVLLFALYISLLVAFGVHVQETEYVEGWDDQKFVWRRIIAECPDVKEGMTVLIDVNGLPASQGFSGLWTIGAAGGETLKAVASFPKEWKSAPRVNAYYTWCDHEITDDTLVLKTPSWSPTQWAVIKDGNFIFLRFVDGDLRRINGPIELFGREFYPQTPETKPALHLTGVGKMLLGTKTSARWPWFSKAAPYPRP